MKIGAIILAVFLTLFGLVFVLAGSAVIFLGLTSDGPDEAPWYLVIPFGLVFIGAGSVVIWRALRLPGEHTRIEREREQFSAEPWKRVKAWRSSRIQENTRHAAWFFWGFALFWNGITATVIGIGWEDMLRDAENEPAIYAILLFPLVGIGVLVAAIRQTLRLMKFPASSIHLSTMPASLGGWLEGTLELPDSLREAEHIRVRLTCYRITRSGKNTHSTPVWQDEQDRSPMELSSDGYRAILSVRIGIPKNGLESTVEAGVRISWQMDVSASVPGVDYHAAFSIPVFGTVDTTNESNKEFSSSLSISTQLGEQTDLPRPRTVQMEMGHDGGMLWDFRPGRVKGPAAAVTAFAAVWGAATYFLLIADDAPAVIGVVFAFFELMLLWGVYDMWLTRITVTIRNGMLIRRSGPVMTIRYANVSRNDIRDFTVRSGMSAGSTAYHDIVLVRKNGRKLRLGSYLRSVREAEVIVREIRNALGMEEDSAH